ncbi:MAG TPA: penicillin-binding protein 2 [Ignavibacteriaceae bacterium]|nr:penicillin-binding protein 2 [Ignavibacteriaceae bacterium]
MSTDSFASVERKSIIYFILVAVFSIFFFKLTQMQLFQHELFDEKSAANSIKPIEQIPLRGVFYDRNKNVIVNNVPAYTVRITPSEYNKKLSPILETVLDLDPGYIDKMLYKNRFYSKYIPIRIRRGIDFNAVAWLEENSEHLAGVDYIVEMQRGYPYEVMGSHVFGYSKEISPTQLEKENDYYEPGDYVGHNGIEKTYEKEVRGIKGFNYILVDAKRKEIGKFKDGTQDTKSIKGHDLVLSIDGDVQKVAEQELKGHRGAVVAIEPKTGEIIAMVSAPDYDLNQFSYVTPRDYLTELYTDVEKPLFNRATMSVKPPGSTFKVIAAIAALELGVINENTTISCGGTWYFGRPFKCHGAHGTINVKTAIEKSCNVFFYQLIYKIGLDRWAEYCRKFGFAQKTNVDLNEEVKGFIPTEAFYQKIYGPKWPRSIMASLGIGQGEVSVTPIQLAQYTSLIANNGKTFTPHIVKGYIDDKTGKMIPFKFDELNTHVSQKTFDIVKEGMYRVVNGAGTATSIKMQDINISGKTGTAQNPHGKDHAFFIGFAPSENPKIAFAIVVENVGFGATWAAPIAKKMIMAYLKKDEWKKSQKPLDEQGKTPPKNPNDPNMMFTKSVLTENKKYAR